MTVPFLAAAILLTGALSSIAQTPGNNSPVPLDAKTKAEILAVEKKLADAIEQHDTTSLNSILIDYYADGFNESESAMNKTGAIRSCEQGSLLSYRFGKTPQVSRSGEMVIIQGVAQASRNPGIDTEPADRLMHVRRVWTQNDGHWMLVAQMRHSLEDADAPPTKKSERHPK